VNTLDLIKLGHMIRRTSERVTTTKLAQAPWWQTARTVAGGLAGAGGGYLAHDKLTGGKGSLSGSALSTLGGAGLGAAAAGGSLPWSPAALQAIHAVGGSRALPALSGLAGAVYGGYKGKEWGDTKSPWASGLIGAGLGGAIGLTAGGGVGRGLQNLAVNQARGLVQDTFGQQLAGIARQNAQTAAQGGGGMFGLPNRFSTLLGQDTHNLTGQAVTSNALRNVGFDDMMLALQQGGGSGLAAIRTALGGTRGAASWGSPQDYLRTGQGLGFNVGVGRTLNDWLTQNVSPNAPGYLQGGALLGGGYLGLNAAANVYNRFQRPDPRRDNRGVIVL